MVESLQKLLRGSSLLIAICLLLPLQSCVVNGKEEVFFPLSGEPSQWWMPLAIYLLPLLVWWRRPPLVWRLLIPTAACLGGLYVVSLLTYALQWKGKLLLGWFIYTAAAAVHVLASLLIAWLGWRARQAEGVRQITHK